jgi:alpha-1,6-mannosyltransferase
VKVVDITSFFSATAGGIKRYYRAKAAHLPGAGVECHFVVPGAASGSERFEQTDATLHRVAGPALPGNPDYRRFGDRRALAALLRRIAPDVIEIASHYTLPDWVRSATRGLARAPRVIGFCHTDPRQVVTHLDPIPVVRRAARPLTALGWRFFAWRHRRYDATLLASRHVEEQLACRGVGRLHRVGLGVDLDVFRPAPAAAPARTTRVVAYAGRFSHDKEVLLLPEAFDEVHRETGAHLHLGGGGPLASRLAHHAAARPHVDLRGYLDDSAAVARFLAASDITVVTGSAESFSLAAAEALACGSVVVAPDAGAARELVLDSGAGALFRPGSAKDLARVLIDLLRRPDLPILAARGPTFAGERLGWSGVMSRIHQVYQRTLESPGR